MTTMPPGLSGKTTYYIRVDNYYPSGAIDVWWVARYVNSRFWNIGSFHADPFRTLAEAKRVLRHLTKSNAKWPGVRFSIVEVVMNPVAKTIFPLEVLDRLAQIEV